MPPNNTFPTMNAVPRSAAKEHASRAQQLKRTIEDRQGFGDFIKQNFGYEKKKRSNKVKMRWNDVVSIGVLPSLDRHFVMLNRPSVMLDRLIIIPDRFVADVG